MPGGIGIWEIAVLAVVALLVFGPKRLPEMGRSLGRGMREFKGAVTGSDRGDDREDGGPQLGAAPEDGAWTAETIDVDREDTEERAGVPAA